MPAKAIRSRYAGEWGNERKRKGTNTYEVIQDTVEKRERGVHCVGEIEENGIGFVSCIQARLETVAIAV